MQPIKNNYIITTTTTTVSSTTRAAATATATATTTSNKNIRWFYNKSKMNLIYNYDITRLTWIKSKIHLR